MDVRRTTPLLLLAACGAAPEPAPPAGPSVLLISIDMLRADHVGCYGYGRNTTPTLDALAARGVRFAETATTAPWTLPAHAALFTSVPDSVHGVAQSTGVALAPDAVTLAERYRGAGYATGGFYAGPYLHGAYGLGQGFDVYRYCADYAGEYDPEQVEQWGADPAAQRRSHHGTTNPDVYEAAKGWLEDLPEDAPFFAFVHLWDTHYDFTPPAPYDSMFTDPAYDGWVTGREFFFDPRIQRGMAPEDLAHLVALYDGEIRWTDAFVRKLLDDLERLGRLDNTLVVVTSDHGTELFDHGEKGHRRTLYDEALRVPFILAGPGVPAGLVVEDQASLIDVGPTLLELSGLDPGPTVQQAARSFAGLLAGGAAPEPRAAISELLADGRNLVSLRTPQNKLVRDRSSEQAVAFDLAADPLETEPTPPADADLQVLQWMAEGLQRWATQYPDPIPPGSLPDHIQGALRANGYTGDDD